MNEKKDKMQRVDVNFAITLKDISLKRIEKGLEKELLGTRELTRMMQNTESWNNILNELKTKPRKNV